MPLKTRSTRERRVVHLLLALVMLLIGLFAPMTAYAAPTPSPSDADAKTAPRIQGKADGDVVALAAPDPTPTTSVVTVQVGGDRTGGSSVAPLALVELGLYTAQTGGSRVATCTSDSDGDCNFVVTQTQPGGSNEGDRFWVRQVVDPPDGWYANPALRTGQSNDSGSQSTPYVFQTPRLYGGFSYVSGSQFMQDGGNNDRTASGGIWQQSRDNPVAPASCGLDVALILDLSGSVGSALPDLKEAADTFTDSLVGTPSRMSLFSFSDKSPANGASQNYPSLVSVSTAAQAGAFKSRYAGWGSDGGTNWDRGLGVVAEATDVPDIAVIITDGNPTTYGDPFKGPRSFNRLREVENGIFSANGVKAQGTRVLAVAVGPGAAGELTGLNLRAISGPIVFDGTNADVADYYQTSTYDEAGAALRDLALGNCSGSISVTKLIVPSGNAGNDITGAAPADAGWVFQGSTTTAGIGGLPATKTTTGDGTGSVNFPLTFPGGVTSAPVTITETQQPGYTLVTQGAANAVCRNLIDGASVSVTNVAGASGPGFTVDTPSTGAISCSVYNRAPDPVASVVLEKSWEINGTSYEDGAQPPEFAATGSIDGTDEPWGSERGGFQEGDSVSLDEEIESLPPQCELTSNRLTDANGTTVDLGLPADQTLQPGLNRYTITNVVSCQTLLSLEKVVRGGTEPAQSWTLSAEAEPPALPGPSGTSGSPGATGVDVTPDAVYTLSESGGSPLYTPFVVPSVQLVPGASASWICRETGQDGRTIVRGFADGANGAVQVPIGHWIRCTVINETATLQLRKLVDNAAGGTAVPSDWSLTATPVGDDLPPDLEPVTLTGSAIFQPFNVRPGTQYALTESAGPDGYELVDVSCVVARGAPRSDRLVSMAPEQTGSCTFLNRAQPPSWSIIKLSAPESGATVQPGDEITYAVGLIRNEGVDPRDVVVTDDLSQVLNNATLVEGPFVRTGTAVISGNTLTWNVPVLSEDFEFVLYTVRVDDDAFGVTLKNQATSPGSSPCVEDGSAERASLSRADRTSALRAALAKIDRSKLTTIAAAADDELCPTTTEHYTPEWTLEKSSDPAPGSTVQPGAVIAYTLTASNTSANATLSGATAADDLSAVLDHGSLVSVPAGATLDETTLTWHIPDLDPGESATLTYQIKLDEDAWDVTVSNVATPGDGGTCPTTCTTDHITPPEPSEPHEPNLPNTGGPALATLGIGLALLAVGGGVLLWSRRRKAE